MILLEKEYELTIHKGQRKGNQSTLFDYAKKPKQKEKSSAIDLNVASTSQQYQADSIIIEECTENMSQLQRKLHLCRKSIYSNYHLHLHLCF